MFCDDDDEPKRRYGRIFCFGIFFLYQQTIVSNVQEAEII